MRKERRQEKICTYLMLKAGYTKLKIPFAVQRDEFQKPTESIRLESSKLQMN